MSLGEYLGSGSAVTKGLRNLNGNSNDASGNGNNGTDSSMSYVDGRFRQCGRYSGAATSRTTGLSNLGISGGTITLGCWFLVTNSSFGLGNLLNQSSNSTFTKYSIFYTPSTTEISFFRTKNGIANEGVTLTRNLNTGRNQVMLTYDGTDVRGYINGSLVGTTATSGNGSGAGRDARGIGVLHRESAPQYTLYMQADIDECIIENRVWTSQEIQKYYTYAKGSFGIQ